MKQRAKRTVRQKRSPTDYVQIGLIAIVALAALALLYTSLGGEKERVGQVIGTLGASCTSDGFSYTTSDGRSLLCQNGVFVLASAPCTEGSFYMANGELNLNRCTNGVLGSCTGDVCTRTKTITITTNGGHVGVDNNGPTISTQLIPRAVGTTLHVSVAAEELAGTAPSAPDQNLVTKLLFTGWGTGPAPNSDGNIRVTTDATYTALWEKKHKVITAIEDQGCVNTGVPAGTVTLSPSLDLNGFYTEVAQQQLTATATPTTGYKLTKWRIKYPGSGAAAGSPVSAVQEERQPTTQIGPQTLTLSGDKPYEITAVFSPLLACTHIEGESLVTLAGGLQRQADSTASGGEVLAYITNSKSATYTVTIPGSGITLANYLVMYAVSTPNSGTSVQLSVDGIAYSSTAVPNTGGWSNWRAIDGGSILGLVPGTTHTIKLTFSTPELYAFNLDYFALTEASPSVCGNNVVEAGEQCDSNLGQACTALYGGTCSYCSNSCQTVTLTGPFCGDSVVQTANGEQCDGTQVASGLSLTCPTGYTGSKSCTSCQVVGTCQAQTETASIGVGSYNPTYNAVGAASALSTVPNPCTYSFTDSNGLYQCSTSANLGAYTPGQKIYVTLTGTGTFMQIKQIMVSNPYGTVDTQVACSSTTQCTATTAYTASGIYHIIVNLQKS